MYVNAVKHRAKLLEWKDRVADCRSSGMSVKHWCEENGCFPKTYYRFEQEILGKVVMMEHTYDADTAYLEDLMPWPRNLPDICKKTS